MVGPTGIGMDTVVLRFKMAIVMSVNSTTKNGTVQVCTRGAMDAPTKVHLKMTSGMGTERSRGQMVRYTLEVSTVGNVLVMARMISTMVISMSVNG